ncbi:MAG: monovalent cation/H(+) antiporter subunit G [Yoonia sp.]|jgi:multicomponent Na+:H+ antiporter subunit G|uniref:monovalent cation/H(+) antiporter subunit G n=1 Tax=Yoonia sp. TaxID=2212373 RepID=UPI00273E0F9A|nr:monovalent cation/H(+) antiporter subunit G [Yoonia sp.]MDP5084384.1 monovalent cation/H(+) antiporter subunit G [Yoonia sp.]MDP5358603.1 monovalent cation/H(+) antiporter subunit G [Paracoccaceae bacterium]MDP5362073.1 monovalent cation/H(+) antiporter subunit G [Paracoccaceae bacterium]
MTNIVISIFLLLGGFFALIAAIGVLRLPDVLTRMHASTKAGILGSSLILIGGAIYLQDTEVTSRVIATILFLMLTSPIGAHMIGRAAVRDLKTKKRVVKNKS